MFIIGYRRHDYPKICDFTDRKNEGGLFFTLAGMRTQASGILFSSKSLSTSKVFSHCPGLGTSAKIFQ